VAPRVRVVRWYQKGELYQEYGAWFVNASVCELSVSRQISNAAASMAPPVRSKRASMSIPCSGRPGNIAPYSANE
jgi:hypothetical protein